VQHLAFGHGVHYCLGAPLARLVAVTGLEAFYGRFSTDRTGIPEPTPVPSYASQSYASLESRLRRVRQDAHPPSRCPAG
jgi:cytochrome P450